MMKNKKNKAGFTLVELMVVAIIVAILAAVAVPLMTGNRERAAATEAQAGCSTIATAMRVARAQYGVYTNVADAVDLPGISDGDLDGTYFDDDSYALSGVGAGFTITATSRAGAPDGIDGTVIMTVGANGSAGWSGTLLTD
jgi:prepilin-type N-terminal cleavage/methylation domain-containing protein